MKHVHLRGCRPRSWRWASVAQAQTTLTMWYHGAGNEVEAKIINEMITDFNASQTDWKVELQSFPQAAYNDSRRRGRAGGQPARHPGRRRPDHAELGLGRLHAAAARSTRRKIANFLPGTEGHWNGKLYSIGLWDAAVALVDPPVDAGRARPAHADAGRSPGPGTSSWRRSTRPRHRASSNMPLDLGMAWTGRMVSLCLLALPAVASAATSSTARPTRPPKAR